MTRKLKTSSSGETYISESATQISCVKWFKIVFAKYEGLLFSIPNGSKLGGKVNKNGFHIQGAILKGEGMQAGVADLFFALPKNGFNGLFIEMKTPIGTLQPEQRKFLESMSTVGYACAVCRSLNEFETTVKAYVNSEFEQTPIWAYKRAAKKTLK